MHDGWRFTVEELDGRRVRRVRIGGVSEAARSQPETEAPIAEVERERAHREPR